MATRRRATGTIEANQVPRARDEITRAVLVPMVLEKDARAEKRTERGFVPLRTFVREAWSSIRPEKLSWNWHMDDICDHLEAITFGVLGRFDQWQPYDGRPALTPERYERLRNLVINVPPRSTKSIIISVCWPAWAWAEVDPSIEWLFSSYAQDLSFDHSRMCRDLRHACRPRYRKRLRQCQAWQTASYLNKERNNRQGWSYHRCR